MKKQQFTITGLCLLMFISLVLIGCSGSKEGEEDIQEKAPPDIIQLAPEAALTNGFQTLTIESKSANSQILTTGEINANENRVFRINSFVVGRIIRDNVLLGDVIRPGQTLAVVQNLEVAKIQADYIHQLHQNEIEINQAQTRLALAQKNLTREQRLLTTGISPRKDYQQAEADAVLARSDLAGKLEHQVHINSEGKALLGAYGIRPGNAHSEQIQTGSPVTAPRSGVITKKSVTLGDMVTPETVMYEVSDLSQVWLNITVYPKELSLVHVGQIINFSTDSLSSQTFTGRINYIQPGAKESTRTYIARAYLNNSQGLLKPGMFGQVRIDQVAQQPKPFVPEEAIQKYGRENFVFIPVDKNRFRKQTVELGEKVFGGYLVNSGLQGGEKVIGKGSFILKAEMLKSQFAKEE